MGPSVLITAASRIGYGVAHVHRSLVSNPSSSADWDSNASVSAVGRHSLITLDGRLAVASMTAEPYASATAMRTVLPDIIITDAWQSRQLTGTLTSPQMGDALGLASGRLAFCFINAASGGTVVFAQANAIW